MRELTGMEVGFVSGGDGESEVDTCESVGTWADNGTTGAVGVVLGRTSLIGAMLAPFVAPVAGSIVGDWVEGACGDVIAGVDVISGVINNEYPPLVLTNPFHHQPPYGGDTTY